MQNAKKHMDLFGEKNGPSIIIEFPDIYKNNYIAAKNRGVKIRFITEITEDNIHYCKELMNIVTEFRHLDGLVGGIAVTESEYMTTTTLRKKELLTQVLQQCLRSCKTRTICFRYFLKLLRIKRS